MPWPTPQDYNEAIQNPALCFADPELRAGVPDLTPIGLPRPITGNFASVYRLRCPGHDWAVRCFFREYSDMSERYASISRHLAATPLDYTVGFQYLERGIQVRGVWYPVLKMEWVEGRLLNEFVEEHLDEAARLRRLASRWLTMSRALDRAQIGHGDLQHGNVMVVGDALKLVDYDGMFVPALAGRVSHEIGHQNYQHPSRTGHHFAASIDHFSSWVIYVSLLAVSGQPELWERVNGGDECLLFRRADYEAPGTSEAFRRLQTHPDQDVRLLSGNLERFLSLGPCDVPALPVPSGDQGRRRSWPGLTRFRSDLEFAPVALPSSPVPAWVSDVLAASAAERSFASPRDRLRLSLAATSTVAVIFLVASLFLSSLFDLALAAASLAGGAVLLTVAFGRDEAVAERRRVTARERAAERALVRLQREIERCRREQERLDQRHGETMARLAVIESRLRDRERRDLEEVEVLLGERARALAAELRAVDREEKQTLARMLEVLQQKHVQRALRRARLLTAHIEDVGWTVKLSLYLPGVRSARDVHPGHATSLKSIHPTAASRVIAWRVAVEAEARRTMPRELPPVLRRPVSAEFGHRRGRLKRTTQRTRAQQERQVEAARERYARLRRPVDRRVSEKTATHAEHSRSIEERLAALHAEEPIQSRRLAEARRELDAFRCITFQRYVVFVLLPS